MSALRSFEPCATDRVIEEICNLGWLNLAPSDMLGAAWAYYYFSIQFRENLEIACSMFPEDENLARLKAEECATDNLSPYPGIAKAGEKLNHDEFMRRAVDLVPIPEKTAELFRLYGDAYLAEVRAMTPQTRGLSIGNYESGGLEQLFKAMLTSPEFDNAAIKAFRFFMEEHIRFDSDPIAGHGALSRIISPDDSILPLWQAFKRLLLLCVPKLQLDRSAQPILIEA